MGFIMRNVGLDLTAELFQLGGHGPSPVYMIRLNCCWSGSEVASPVESGTWPGPPIKISPSEQIRPSPLAAPLPVDSISPAQREIAVKLRGMSESIIDEQRAGSRPIKLFIIDVFHMTVERDQCDTDESENWAGQPGNGASASHSILVRANPPGPIPFVISRSFPISWPMLGPWSMNLLDNGSCSISIPIMLLSIPNSMHLSPKSPNQHMLHHSRVHY